MRPLFALFLLSSALVSACAHDRYSDSNYYLGHIRTCTDEANSHNAPTDAADKQPPVPCQTFKTLFDNIKDQHQCTKIDTPCPEGTALLNDIFGTTRRRKFANFIAYYHKRADEWISYDPILMWNDKNTRYLYGVGEIYVMVFTDQRVCFDAHLTTIAKSQLNPFDAILRALGKPLAPAAPEIAPEVAPKTQAAHFVWYPLDGNFATKGMWLAIGAVPVELNTTDWITVHLAEPKLQSKRPIQNNTTKVPNQSSETTPQPGKLNTTDECSTESSESALDTNKQPVLDKLNYLADNAFFSNNRDSRVAVAVAFGLTFTGGEIAPEGTNNPSLNGYALAEFYPSSRFTPKLRTDPNSGGAISSTRSLGVFAGTNITHTLFNELIFGISWGHVLGNVGFVAGINYFVPARPSPPPSGATTSTAPIRPSSRHGRPFFGVEYAF